MSKTTGQKPTNEPETPQRIWRLWYLLLMVVLAAEILLFKQITDFFDTP